MKKYELSNVVTTHTDTMALVLPKEYLETLDRIGVDVVSTQFHASKGRGLRVDASGLTYTRTEEVFSAYTLKIKD